MKVDTMRRIDYYGNVPFCIIGIILCKLCRLLGKPDQKTLQNILFIEFPEMGGAVLCDPARRKLQGETGTNIILIGSIWNSLGNPGYSI
jgi:hypothetical protein